MKKQFLALCATCSLLMGTAAPVSAEGAGIYEKGNNVMNTFYVSPNGSDTNSGQSQQTPFATLDRAKKAVAAVNGDMTGDIVVYLMDGTWELADTLTFGEADSGTNGYYIRYEAAPGAHPVISGGTELTNNWTVYEMLGNGNTVYKTPLTRDSKLRALYVNGERAYMAQTENAVPVQGTWGTYTIPNSSGTPNQANLALGKTATASSNEDNHTPEMAVDGIPDSRWASRQENGDNAWVYVDLGNVYDIGTVVLDWESAYAKAYKLQVSNNAANWTDIYSTTDGRGGKEEIKVSCRGRYVRMQGSERVEVLGVKYGYSLYEISIFPPGYDPSDYTPETGDLPDWAWTTGAKADGLLYDKSDFPFIDKNIADVEIENQQVWNKNIVCVREMEESGNGKWIMKLQQPYGAIAQTPGWGMGLSGSGNHIIRNAYVFLDQPGEFYFDRAEQALYYIPREGEDLKTASVVVPRLDTVVRFEGTPVVSGDMTTAGEKTITGQAKNIVFNGITVAHSDWNLQKVGNSYGKSTVQAGTVFTAYASGNWHADMYRNLDTLPGAIEMEFAHNIKILNGEVKLTGAEGVLMANDVDGCEVTGNYIYQTAGGGVVVGNPQHIYENDSLEPDTYYYHYIPGDGKPEVHADGAAASHEKYQNGTERAPRNITVSNNLLLDNCTLFPSHCPITSFYTQHMEVSHNHIRNAAYSGMSIGWGWCNFDGKPGDFTDWGTNNNQGGGIIPGIPTQTCFENQIVYNRIENCMTILADGGAIYTLGEQRGTLIANNYIKDSKVVGIYQDEGSAYFAGIENNVVEDAVEPYVAKNYGRKHDLPYRNNYANGGGNSVHTEPASLNITMEDFHLIWNGHWPGEAINIIGESGLTAEYRQHFSQNLRSLYNGMENALLPTSASLLPGEAITLNAWLPATDEIWVAPAGATDFAVGNSMTVAPGNAPVVYTPVEEGEYKLYIKQGDTFSAACDATLYVEKEPPVYASGCDEQSHTPDKAIDGNLETRWASDHSDTAWITVNLYDIQTIDSIELYWEDAYAKNYVLQVSNDNKNWSTVYETTAGKGGHETIEVDSVGQYVRMQGQKNGRVEVNGQLWGYSLWEFVVNATDLPVESLSLEGPIKTEYTIGEQLDLTGLTVTAHYGGGTSKTIPQTEWTVSGFNSSFAGEKTVTIQYKGALATFTVTVQDKIHNAVPGDVNADQEVTSADALLALQGATGKLDLTTEQEKAADVNGQAGVTSADALMILQYATQKISRFPLTTEI